MIAGPSREGIAIGHGIITFRNRIMWGSEEKTDRQLPPAKEGAREPRCANESLLTRASSNLAPSNLAQPNLAQTSQHQPGLLDAPPEKSLASQGCPDLPFAALLDGMLEGCQVIDFELRYIYLNPSALRQARRALSELVGKKMSDCFPGIETTELYAVLGKCLRERVDCRFENEFAFPNGANGVFDLHIVPAPQGLFIFSIDISESRRLSSQMRQSQSVIAIGQLAAGAAHDLANLLTVVTGSSEILLERLAENDVNRPLAVNIRDAADRCADMVSQILAFRRQTSLRSKWIDLNKIIADARPMLQHLVGERVQIQLQLETIAGSVNIHPTQLEQILMNLAINARDAMPDGGLLTIATSAEPIPTELKPAADSQAIRVARITVIDTGAGMSEEVLARVFEPFFTTKREGSGAGLGLPTVYSIVQQAGGSVSVASSPGMGASFSISLPIFE